MAKPQVAFGLTWVSNQKYKNTNNNWININDELGKVHEDLKIYHGWTSHYILNSVSRYTLHTLPFVMLSSVVDTIVENSLPSTEALNLAYN
jgi:hypothetical protein